MAEIQLSKDDKINLEVFLSILFSAVSFLIIFTRNYIPRLKNKYKNVKTVSCSNFQKLPVNIKLKCLDPTYLSVIKWKILKID